MLFEKLCEEQEFYFINQPEEIYIIDNYSNICVGYHAKSGKHTFAAFMITPEFIERTQLNLVNKDKQ